MSRLSEYVEAGEADGGRVRTAGLWDAVGALVLALLAWPFPVMRAVLPLWLHIPLVLFATLAVDFGVRAVSVSMWGRTPAMYFLDLGLSGRKEKGVARSLRWAGGWTLALVPTLFGARALVHPTHGLPARLSGLETVATR